MITGRAIVVTAPGSGHGKTTVSLGLMRAFRDAGVRVRSAKSGPDYIDPAFHRRATGHPSVNLDPWAMSRDRRRSLLASAAGDLTIVEGAMGALDSAADGLGSTVDLAVELSLPAVLVIDISRQGQSATIAPAGIRAIRPDLTIAGIILNNAGSSRHARLAARACEDLGFRVLGSIRRDPALSIPTRHLGLVLPCELDATEVCISLIGRAIAESVDIDAVLEAAAPIQPHTDPGSRVPPLGQRVAIAQDAAFSFLYQHFLQDWRDAGAELSYFAPLQDEAPVDDADAILLPGGYPELYAERLSQAVRFRTAMVAAAGRGARIYGECGGFMALGRSLVDAEGTVHPMLGLLPIDTSFAERNRALGYRRLRLLGGHLPWQSHLVGHEFHYSTLAGDDADTRLFQAETSDGKLLGEIGAVVGRTMGSYAHVIGIDPSTAPRR